MHNRRNFLKAAGLAGLPVLLGSRGFAQTTAAAGTENRDINFYLDCDQVSPKAYAEALRQFTESRQVTPDVYGNGGVVADLERAFAGLTGMEAAVYMPSGTMANQLAIKVLSGDKPKVFVQETSHVYRDEADAAQAVHNKRLIPLAAGKAAFTQAELKDAYMNTRQGEYMSAAVGAVSIENPVRRLGNACFPMSDIKQISEWCRAEGFPLHLDGARLHIASAWSGIGIKEYAGYFDTVYISLYKYLGAPGGAILCGSQKVMEPMRRLIKIYGGNQLHSWPYAALALQNLQGIDERLQQVKQRAGELALLLNETKKITLKPLPNGTNTYTLGLPLNCNVQKFRQWIFENEQILLAGAGEQNTIPCVVNESLLKRPAQEIADAMLKAAKEAVVK